MRLLEFKASNILIRDLVGALSHYFDMERVGGDSRIYQVGGRKGVIYMLNNSLRALGLIYSATGNRVESVGVWHQIDFDRAPDYVTDIPEGANMIDIIDPLVKFVKQPREGIVEGVLAETSRRNVSPDEFTELVRKRYGEKAAKLSFNDLKDLSDHYGIHLPSAIRLNPALKVDGNHWNLAHAPSEPTQAGVASVVQDLKGTGELILMGRKPTGELFEIPGVSAISNQLDRMLKTLIDSGKQPVQGGSSMERQYSELEKKIEMIAGGQSEFIKSLLITGMPSAGKTFRVMKVLREMGLSAGENYVTKKGKISAKALYRVLIQQLHGLAVFDDCDSVVKDENGVNMLKGALDTDPIRTVDYDVQGLMNTDAMSFERRGEIVGAMSAILRGVPTEAELAVIEALMGKKAEAKAKAKNPTAPAQPARKLHPDMAIFNPSIGWDDDDDADEEVSERVSDMARIREAEDFVMNNLPNKIDFYGRIIFISNMTPAQWAEVGDGAIINRAFTQNMNFPDNEMLDYIDTIKDHIKTPRLTDDQKSEVLAYLRELWEAGKVNKPINFRLVQSSFDLFLLNGWKELVAANCQ